MRYLLSCLLCLGCISSFSQDFEWTKVFASKKGDGANKVTYTKNNNIYLITNFSDTLIYDADTIIYHSNYGRSYLLVKLNPDGKLSWYKEFSSPLNSQLLDVISDDNDNVYVSGDFASRVKVDSLQLFVASPDTNNINGFVVEFDSSGIMLWSSQCKSKKYSTLRNIRLDNNHNLYCFGTFEDSTYFNTMPSFSGKGSYCIKFNNLKNILFYKKYFNNASSVFLRDVMFSNNKFYYTGQFRDTIIAGPLSIYSSGSFDNFLIVEIDTNGVVVSLFKDGFGLDSNAYSAAMGIGKDINNNIYVCGTFYNKVAFSGVIPKKQTGATNVIVSYTQTYQLRWVKAFTNNSTSGVFYCIASSGNYIYAAGLAQNDYTFDNFITYKNEGILCITKVDTNGNVLWVQRGGSSMRGNPFNGITVDPMRNAYVCGIFSDTLILKKDTMICSGNEDGFLTKIRDIGIYLDSIKPTTYCTGDSIKIPFISYGNFDTANYISVQISDSSGKFDSIFYTLSTVTFKQGGDTIACKLPDTLLTSSHYKIKVFTTVNHVSNFDNNTFYSIYSKPEVSAGNDTSICTGASVQLNAKTNMVCSFLWQPATGLNDSAIANPIARPMVNTTYIVKAMNPAGCFTTYTITITTIKKPAIKINDDTAFCKGGSVLLQAMRLNNDSVSYYHWIDTLGTILGSYDTLNVTPIATTKYRLVTANVLGCTDTQSVEITVYRNLKITNIKDTTICNGSAPALDANGTGGDTAMYNFNLYNGNTLLQNNHTGLFSIAPLITNTYSIILSGGCAANDTLNFLVTVRAPLKIAVNTTDTTLCYGSSFSVKANATGGDSLNYSFTLYNIENSFMTSNHAGIFNIAPNATTHYNLKVSDGCTLLNDSIDIVIRIIPVLSNKSINDTIVCLGSTVNYSANPQGGDSTNYNYAWWSITDNASLSNTNILNTLITKTQTVVLQISDGRCNNYSDTFDIDVLPDFNATLKFNPDSGCIPVTLQLTLPTITTLHSYQYIGALDPGDGNPKIRQTITTNQAIPDMFYTYTKAGIFSASFTLYNKLGNIICSAVMHTITVFPKPVAAFQPIPLKTNILRPTILFKNNSLGADAFVWYFGDGTQTQTTGLTDVQNEYSDTGTFKIMLVATNAIGCSDTAYGKVMVEDSFTCFIPNVFTPNHDKTNETFAPVCSNTLYYTMDIYNRWGTRIYQSPEKEKFPSWDGSINGIAVPEGIFIYMITARDATNKVHTYKGTVTLIR